MFDISLDQFIFPDSEAQRSATRRRVDVILNALNDTDLSIIEATAKSLRNAHNP